MIQLNMKIRSLLFTVSFGLFALAACGSGNSATDNPGTDDPDSTAKDVTIYTTSVNGDKLNKSTAAYSTTSNMSPSTITLDGTTTYQKMDGFGAAITYSTAYNLLKMTKDNRTKFLKQTFSNSEGYGYSYVRISIGCSDFSSTEYTCCDTKGINNFGLYTDDINYVIPVLKEILAINPNIRIIGSPWTCPRWMKVEDLNTKTPYNSWTGGHLNPDYYQDYATYFIKWIQAYENSGIPIYAVTPQNEPLNTGNCASTYIPWDEEAAFVKVLAGTFKNNSLSTKIYVFDHNFNYDDKSDQNDYPIKVYNALGNCEGAEYVVGAAYHDYGGSYTELADIHNQNPSKGLIFTETSIGEWNDGRNLSTRLMSDMESVALGTVNNYCTAVMVWNLMLDTNKGPNLDGGCQTCYGAVDISPTDYTTITKNSHYYIIAHLASVVKPDAVRIAATAGSFSTTGLSYAAFKNTDGTYATVLCNNNSTQKTIVLSDGIHHFTCSLPAYGIVSCIW
jgi:glucosylceramidase